MDAINQKIVNANIQLQDENKVLKEDKKILQKRQDMAIDIIEEMRKDNQYNGIGNELSYIEKILKGDYIEKRSDNYE